MDVARYDDADYPGSIFRTTGDQAIVYCLVCETTPYRGSYADGSSLYPTEGDIVVTYTDGRREIMKYPHD